MKKAFTGIVALLAFVAAEPALAATLNLAPAVGSFEVGETFSIGVAVTSDQPVNAVAATVTYPAELLEAVSVSKEGSAISTWPVGPAIAAEKGQIRFEGVAFGGFQGAKVSIVTIVFRTKNIGSARLAISSAEVLAHDGKGTDLLESADDLSQSSAAALALNGEGPNILRGTSGAVIDIRPASNISAAATSTETIDSTAPVLTSTEPGTLASSPAADVADQPAFSLETAAYLIISLVLIGYLAFLFIKAARG